MNGRRIGRFREVDQPPFGSVYVPGVDRGYANDDAAMVASLLDWWAEAGVDSFVDEDARDWLAPNPPRNGEVAARSADGGGDSTDAVETPPPPLAARAVPLPVPGRIEEPLPDQLLPFQEWLRTSSTLPYAAPTAPRVCPVGDPAAGLMILTAMPSAEDCREGSFLSGASGRLFDRMLAAIGRSRDTAYIAGLSCLRPSAGRFDAPGAGRCAAIARRHIGLAEPRALLLLGDDCCKALLGDGVAKSRGRVHELQADGRVVKAVATLHPDYLLAQPAYKAHAWADLLLLKGLLA